MNAAIALVRSHSAPQNQLYQQYVDLAFRLGQRIGALAGYTAEQRVVLAKEQLEKVCSQINVWPAAAADLSVHAWTALGIGVISGDLLKHMSKAMADGLRSA